MRVGDLGRHQRDDLVQHIGPVTGELREFLTRDFPDHCRTDCSGGHFMMPLRCDLEDVARQRKACDLATITAFGPVDADHTLDHAEAFAGRRSLREQDILRSIGHPLAQGHQLAQIGGAQMRQEAARLRSRIRTRRSERRCSHQLCHALPGFRWPRGSAGHFWITGSARHTLIHINRLFTSPRILRGERSGRAHRA